jgi:hypothetical protein
MYCSNIKIPEKDYNAKVLYPQGGFLFAFRESQGGFLFAFRECMRGLCDLMKIRPSALLMFGWSSVSLSLADMIHEGIEGHCGVKDVDVMFCVEDMHDACQTRKHKAFQIGPLQNTECILELTMSSAISFHRQTKM